MAEQLRLDILHQHQLGPRVRCLMILITPRRLHKVDRSDRAQGRDRGLDDHLAKVVGHADWGHYGPFFIRMALARRVRAKRIASTMVRGGSAAGMLPTLLLLNSWSGQHQQDQVPTSVVADQEEIWPAFDFRGPTMIFTGRLATRVHGIQDLRVCGGRAEGPLCA